MDKSRTENLIGKEGLEKLSNLHVTVVGVGGVGGYVATMLVRAGVEKIKIIDFDSVSPSNINRQIIAFESTIGRQKVDILKEMLVDINSNACVEEVNERLTEENIDRLIGETDFVVDAIDSVQDKIALIVYCKKHKINIISAMGAGNRYAVPEFEKIDIFKTHDDGLAKVVRKRLREEDIESLEVVCAKTPVQHKSEKGNVGSISFYPAMCGCVIAGEIINKVLRGEI